MTIAKSYPAGSVTPHGAYYFCQGQMPTMKLRAWDDTMVFTLMGGEAIPDYYNSPETVYVKDMKGLVPPWKQIDQKGATEDGRTFVTSLYDPAEVEVTAVVKGKTPAAVQQTRDDLYACLDAIQTSELSWFTHRLGYWWAPVRWMAAPVDVESPVYQRKQTVSLRLRAYDAFWRTFDVVDQLRTWHLDAPEYFGTDYGSDLGSGWDISVSGGGSGGISVSGGQAVPTVVDGNAVVARRNGWTGSTPVVELQLGSFPQWFFDSNWALDFWAMSGSGTPGNNGIRVRVTRHNIQLHQFSGGVGTLINTAYLTVPPMSGESWTFVGGPAFKVLRSGALVYYCDLGSAPYTSAGFGLYSGATVPPPSVKYVAFGTDDLATSFGYVRMVNWGDQPMPPRFTCVGPGTFWMGNGPGATEYVKLGPLADGQIAQVLTDSRKRGVTDLSFTPTPEIDPNPIGAGLQDLLSFVNNYAGIIQTLTGLFGSSSQPLPQYGNIYSLLEGRFSSAAYIPPKPAGRPPDAYYIPVQIEGGNSNSQIIAAGTPLRRMPY